MTLLARAAAFLLALAPLTAFAQAMDPADLPPVDSVFKLSAEAPTRDRIELQWQIAPGYYLYRHRTKVEVLGDGFQAGALQIPDGKKHHDEFFGDVETYRGELKVSLPGNAEVLSQNASSTPTMGMGAYSWKIGGLNVRPEIRLRFRP